MHRSEIYGWPHVGFPPLDHSPNPVEWFIQHVGWHSHIVGKCILIFLHQLLNQPVVVIIIYPSSWYHPRSNPLPVGSHSSSRKFSYSHQQLVLITQFQVQYYNCSTLNIHFGTDALGVAA